MPNAELRTDHRKLRTGGFAAIDRNDDPIFVRDYRHPNLIMRAGWESIEDVKDADRVAVKSDQLSQRFGERATEALVEEKLRRPGVHAAKFNDS